MFPNIFRRARNKNGLVMDHILWVNNTQQWDIRGRRNWYEWELDEVNNLTALLNAVVVNTDEDRWRWKGGHGGNFSVSSFHEDLTSHKGEEGFPSQIVWNVNIPYKIKVFIWCLIWGRLLTVDRLRRLGTPIPNRCSLCQREEETIDHLFQTCSFTKTVWEALLDGVDDTWGSNQVHGETKIWLQGWPKLNSNRWGTTVWKLTPYAVLWAVWKSRNEVIFNDKSFSAERVVMRAKAYIWYWCLGKEVRRGHHFSELLHNWVSVVKGVG
ncbi:Reverse transcriptase zinc-binding domain [Thalictrum thalictroides]|uniref:Reverse transcriptase zinc-binding domain n=1 Tax=Thalictrum thalictroides TaxID=46969 RepID=A0A7J6X2C1_THATH|nr:Reverse transcriptase zinc-binding domain [Thalictrum thalictroides]